MLTTLHVVALPLSLIIYDAPPAPKGDKPWHKHAFQNYNFTSFSPTVSPSDHWPFGAVVLLWLDQCSLVIIWTHIFAFSHHYGSCRTLELDCVLYDNCVSMVTGSMYIGPFWGIIFNEPFNCWATVAFVHLNVFFCVAVYLWVPLRFLMMQVNREL